MCTSLLFQFSRTLLILPYLFYPAYFTLLILPLLFYRATSNIKQYCPPLRETKTNRKRALSFISETRRRSVRGQGNVRKTFQTIFQNETIASKLAANEMLPSFFRIIPKQVKTQHFSLNVSCLSGTTKY